MYIVANKLSYVFDNVEFHVLLSKRLLCHIYVSHPFTQFFKQVCEMHVAGYKFVILNNAFLIHDGWKFAGKFYAKKDVDNAQNWILFNYHFKVS